MRSRPPGSHGVSCAARTSLPIRAATSICWLRPVTSGAPAGRSGRSGSSSTGRGATNPTDSSCERVTTAGQAGSGRRVAVRCGGRCAGAPARRSDGPQAARRRRLPAGSRRRVLGPPPARAARQDVGRGAAPVRAPTSRAVAREVPVDGLLPLVLGCRGDHRCRRERPMGGRLRVGEDAQPIAARNSFARSIARRLGWRMPPLGGAASPWRCSLPTAPAKPRSSSFSRVASRSRCARSTWGSTRTLGVGCHPASVSGLASGCNGPDTRGRCTTVCGDGSCCSIGTPTMPRFPPSTRPEARDRLRRRVLAGAVPRPNLILVLDAPAEELLRRKGEHDLEQLERDRRHYLAVADASPHAAVLDATRPPEDVARAAAARIWAALAARS